MQVEIVRNDRVIAGPMPFEAARVRDIVARQGGDYRLIPNGMEVALNIKGVQVLPVKHDRPSINVRTERYGTPERTVTDTGVVYAYPVEGREAEDIRTELAGELAAHHEAEDQGRFEHRGVMIACDLEARINARGVLEAFENGMLTETRWRGRSKVSDETGEEGPSRIPVTSAAEMKAIHDAIFARLNACFAAREAVDELLEAASEADLATLDVRAEFDAITDAAMAA